MVRTQTMVQLTDELVAELDAEAERRNVSRSALIREAVTQYLETTRRSAAVERYVTGYRRVPPGTPDEWGDLDAQADRTGRELAQRIDAEAAEAGVEW